MSIRRRLLPALAVALLPSAAWAQSSVSATQVDMGLYDVETTDAGGTTTPSGWVEVHDFTVMGGGAPPERHEHWYVNANWKPDAQKITLKYRQGALGHGKNPLGSSGHTHYGFLIVRGTPTVKVAPPGATLPATCTNAHLCPTFHTLKDAKGEVFGYANVWVVGGKTQELYFLDPTKFKPPSPSSCASVWSLGRHDAALPPVVGKEPEKVAPIVASVDTLKWDNRWARQDEGASGNPGTTPIILAANAPKCPP